MPWCLNPQIAFTFPKMLPSGGILDKSFNPFMPELLAFCITLRTLLPSFALSAERICSLPVSRALPAAALNQGTAQRSFGSLGVQCGLFNFKVELNPIHKETWIYFILILFHGCVFISRLGSRWSARLVKCIDFEINYGNATLTLVLLCASYALLFM